MCIVYVAVGGVMRTPEVRSAGPYASVLVVVLLHIALLSSATPQAPPPPPALALLNASQETGQQRRSLEECAPSITGYTFFMWKDHTNDDEYCARGKEVWSILGQAAVCDGLGDACAGFNVDSWGSCIKLIVDPLVDMTGDTLVVCYGTYVKAGNATFPSPPPDPLHPVCPTLMPGYFFSWMMDHIGDDIACAREPDWTFQGISFQGQANLCRMDPTCTGFNIDHLGSCLKNGSLALSPLFDSTEFTPDPCYGFYTKLEAPACIPEQAGFMFIGGVDHVGDDLNCTRVDIWTIPNRADECRADAACQGFNVDGFGTCRKTVVSPLHELRTDWAALKCYGVYVKPTAHPPECGEMPAGFAFLVGLDHTQDDISCIRNEDPSTWNVTTQAAACRADPACTSFNADVLGSCLKKTVLPLTQQWLGVACYGMYVKTDEPVSAWPPSPVATSPPPSAHPTCQRWDDFWFAPGYQRGVSKVFSGVPPGDLASAAAACSKQDQCDGFDTKTVLAYNFSLAPRTSASTPCDGVYIKTTRLYLFPELGLPSRPSAPPPAPPTPPSAPRWPPPPPPVILSPPPPPSLPTASPSPSPYPSGGTVAGNFASSEKASFNASSLPGWVIGVIAGGAVGLIALCAAVIVVVVLRRRQSSGRVKNLPPSSEESASSAPFGDSNHGTDAQVHLSESPSWKERHSAAAKAATLAAVSQPHSASSSDLPLQGACSAELLDRGSGAAAGSGGGAAAAVGGALQPLPPLPRLAALRLAPLVAPPAVAPRPSTETRAEAKSSKSSEAPTATTHYGSQNDSFDVPEGSSLLIDQLHHRGASHGGLYDDLDPELMKAEIQRQNIKLNDEQLELYEQLGRGGSGTVYRGVWKGLPVAAKLMIMHADSKEKAYRQMMEATMSTGLSHTNIVNTYACDLKCLGEVEAQRHSNQHRKPDPLAKTWQMTILQELCVGGSLKALISSGALNLRSGSPEQLQMKLGHVLQLSTDIASGLEHLHSKNIVHSDLTPANVLLQVAPAGSPSRPPGLQWLAKVADFGLSIVFEDGRSHVSRIFAGTPHYIAPETQSKGNISKQSDIFTLGVLMYEMACGMASSGHLSAVTPLGGSVGSSNRPSLSASLSQSRSRSTIQSSDMTINMSLSMPPHLPQTPVSDDATADDVGHADKQHALPPPPPPQRGGSDGAAAAAAAAATSTGGYTTLSDSGPMPLSSTDSNAAVSQEPLLFGGCRGRNGPPMALAPLPPAVPRELRSLIVACLSQTPQHRPTVAQVHQQLSKLLQAHTDVPQPQPPPRPSLTRNS